MMEDIDPPSPEPVLEAPHDESEVASDEPLTKARLFTSNAEDGIGAWTEMGIGVVSIQVELEGGSNGGIGETAEEADDEHSGRAPNRPRGGGKRGAAEVPRPPPRRVGRLVMVALEDSSDVLLSTPVSLDDIYLVQRDSILVWTDPQLGRDMACSFNTREGCDAVLNEIYDYQRTVRAGMANALQDERVMQPSERWAVRRENLPTILEAVTTNTQRFGIFVREHDNYFSELVDLFVAAEADHDTPTLDFVSQITLALLKSPYNTEGKIIGQFVESRVIEKCIDIVQYGIGRRDADTGFVGFEQRRATFRNPCKLPPSFLPRIHVLYACGYLKDLIPLSLEDGDASSSSLLSMFLTQFKLRLMEDICDSPTILPHAFRDASENGPAAFELAAFINDISRTVKNAMILLSAKEHVFDLLTQAGVMGFLHRTLQLAVEAYSQPVSSPAPASAVSPGRAVQMVCDTLSHLLTMQPSTRELLVAASASEPSTCLLVQLMRAMTVVETSAELQSVGDVLVACVIDTIPGLSMGMDGSAPKKRDILHFWINGNGIDRPPLFLLASAIAALFAPPSVNAAAVTSEAGGEEKGEGEGKGETTATTTATAVTEVASASPATPLTMSRELRIVYGLRVLGRLVEEAAEMGLGGGFADLIELSGLLAGLRAALVQRRQRRWANVQSSAVAFIACLICNDDARLLHVLRGDDKVLEACMELFLVECHRDNILSSSTAHVFVALCDRVHHEKRTVTEAGTRPPIAAGPYASFVRGDDSLSAAPQRNAPVHDSQDTVTALVEQYGQQLQAGAPALAERLEHALRETPEEAQQIDAESSSVASTIERFAFNGPSEYDMLAIDFGVEHLGQSPPMEASEMEEQLSVLSRELSEDPLHLDDEAEEGEEDYEGEDDEEEHKGDGEVHDSPSQGTTGVSPDETDEGNLRLATLSPVPAVEFAASDASVSVATNGHVERELKRSRGEPEADAEASPVDDGSSPRSKPRTETEVSEASSAPSGENAS